MTATNLHADPTVATTVGLDGVKEARWWSPRALALCAVAACCVGAGAALSILAGFGADPMTGFMWASSQLLGWSVAATSIAFNTLLIVVCVALRLRVTPAAVVLAAGVGPAYEATTALVAEPAEVWVRVGFVAAAVVLVAFGVALLLASGWGGGGFEVLMVAAAGAARRPVWHARLVMDVVVAAAAVALGAPLGFGIVVCAFGVGPVLRLLQRHPSLSLTSPAR